MFLCAFARAHASCGSWRAAEGGWVTDGSGNRWRLGRDRRLEGDGALRTSRVLRAAPHAAEETADRAGCLVPRFASPGVEEQGTWASRTRKHSEAEYGWPEDGENSPTTPTTTSTSSIRQLLGAADAQTAHPATSSTAPTHQLLGSANAERTPAGAPAAAADRTQRPNATCEGKNG